MPRLSDLSYEERLNDCGLTTQETRYRIKVFTTLNGHANIDPNTFVSSNLRQVK